MSINGNSSLPITQAKTQESFLTFLSLTCHTKSANSVATSVKLYSEADHCLLSLLLPFCSSPFPRLDFCQSLLTGWSYNFAAVLYSATLMIMLKYGSDLIALLQLLLFLTRVKDKVFTMFFNVLPFTF